MVRHGDSTREVEDVATNVTDTTPLLQPPVPTSYDGTALENDLKPTAPKGSKYGFVVCFVGILLFLQGSNISALTTIQSTVATDLDALSQASWLTSTYVIAMSSTSPLIGRFCRIFTPRICIMAASLVFAAGNVVTGFAPSFEGFLVGRAITGMGGAGIIACANILVLHLAPEKRRGLFLGLSNTGFTVGVSLGAILAGGLTPSIGWRALFASQAPLSVLAGLTLLFLIDKDDQAKSQTVWEQLCKIDYAGVMTLTTSLVLFLFSLASTTVQPIPLVTSAFVLALFVLVEARFASDPIIPIAVLKSRGALLGALAAAVLMIGRWIALFYSPLYAIAVREWRPTLAGTMLIPANVGFALGGLAVGWLHIRSAGSFYFSCIIVITLFAMTMFGISRVPTPTTPVALFMALIFANGLCTGAALNYQLVHILHLTAPSTHFITASLMTTFRGFGASFGSAIGGGIFARALGSSFSDLRESYGLPPDEDLLSKLLGSPAIVGSLQGTDKEIAIQSYVTALKTLFAAATVIALGAVLMQSATGWTAPKEIETETEEHT